MFLFNLSSITSSEKVFSGEVHLNRKKMTKRTSTKDIFMKLHEVAPTYLSELDTHRLHSRGHGWHSYDLTSAVKSCLATRKTSPHLLAISLQSDSKTSIPLRRFMQHSYRPFLIVFSNDTQNITLDHMDPYFNPLEVKEALIDPETGAEIKGGRKKKRRRRPLVDDKSNQRDESEMIKVHTLFEKDDFKSQELTEMLHENKIPEMVYPDADLSLRHKRSIYDNEIPEDPYESVRPETPFNLPKTHPGILQGRIHIPATQVQEEVSEDEGGDSKLIPYPEDYNKAKKRKRKERRRRRRKQRRRDRQRKDEQDEVAADILPLPEDWEVDSEVARATVGGQLCGKQKLVVDFADIGWSDWIISPKSFEAHYCAGQCPFPLTKVSKRHIKFYTDLYSYGVGHYKRWFSYDWEEVHGFGS